MDKTTETEQEKRLFLRLSGKTREKVERLADEQKRSMQRQAEFLIEEGIRAQERAAD